MRTAALVCLAIVLAGCQALDGPETTAPTAPVVVRLAVEQVADGLSAPVFLVPIPGTDRFALVEQGGLVRVLDDWEPQDAPLLNLTSATQRYGERGLLGLAFDPKGGSLYVHYTDVEGDVHLARHSWDGSRAGTQGTTVLEIPHSENTNHNGGMVAFGPDGHLYVGVGDGGSGGDPPNNAQDTHSLLGKILRLDVRTADGARPYSIPADNPFADGRGGAPEVWAYGLRNPWRFSFDRATGDLWIGDVGQNAWEEVNLEPKGTTGGRNYGWSAFEGNHRYDDTRDAPGHVPPVFEYRLHVDGSCAVIGGYVYRGQAIAGLQGAYLFADYCSGQLWTLKRNGTAWDGGVALDTGLRVSSLAEGPDGELYILDLNGTIHRITTARL